MIEIKLTIEELEKYLTCGKEEGLLEIDHYRRIIDFDEDHFIGIYYKDFIELDNLDEIGINETINTNKEYWDAFNLKNYGMTTKQRKEDLIARILKVQEEYVLKTGEDATQVISGLLVYNDYPVGVIIPKKILEYESLYNIEDQKNEFKKEDVIDMFEGIRWWIDRLIANGVYPGSLYVGNVFVSRNNIGNVVLDKLDEVGTCRVETKEYVKELAEKGNDLEYNAYHNLKDFRDYYLTYSESNQHNLQ